MYWNSDVLQPLLRECHNRIGLLQGKQSVSESTDEQAIDTQLQYLLASSAIEVEELNAISLRSSLARHLGISEDEAYLVSGRSEGMAELLIDALTNLDSPVTKERLCYWQTLLFPEPVLQITQNIRVGQLRDPEPMQVVSGRLDHQTVHF